MKRYAHIAIVLIFVLPACSAPAAPAPTDEPVTITFMTLPLEPAGFWEDRIAAFEETHPGIHVALYYRQPPDDWPQQADVVLGQGVVREELVKRGWILDLAPLIEADEQFDANDFYPSILEVFKQDNHMWAIPVGTEFDVIVYRPDLFREVGAPTPRPGWTWADVWEACRLLSAELPDGRTRDSLFHEATASAFAVEWIAEQSGGLYQVEGEEIIPRLDHPRVQQAISAYLDTRDQVTTARAEGGYTVEEVLNLVAQGKVGMDVVPLQVVADRLSQYPGLAVAPLPSARMDQHNVRSSSELAISAGTAHPEAAWKWVRFVSRQNAGRGFWPARRSVAETSGVQEQMPAGIVQAALASLENQAGCPRLHPQVSQALYGGLSRALVFIHAPQDIASTLAAVQQEALAAIKVWQEQRASTTPLPISVAAPPLPEGGEQTIEFRITNTSHEPLYTAAIEAFTSAHPEWRVKVSFLYTEQPGCLATYVQNNALTQALTRLSLADLAPLAELDRLPEDDFLPQAIAAVKWGDALYAIPGTVKPLVLYYNSEVFQRAGLESPSAGWTVKDILTAAERIEATTEDWGYLVVGYDVPFLLEQQGIPLFTAGRLPRPRFTEPEVMDALERLRRLGGEGGGLIVPFSEMLSLIESGRVGMWFNMFNYWPTADWLTKTTGVTVIHLRSGTRLPVQVGIYGLDKGAMYPLACWQWIRFLAQQGVAPQDELPALRRLAESETTRQRLGNELFTAYTKALQQDEGTATRDTTVEDWAAWWFVEAIKNATPGDLEAALETAQSQTEAFITCLGPGGGADLEQAQACAQRVDSNHPLASPVP